MINCQKDYSEDKNITSEQNVETNINAQEQNLERIILPFEDPDAGLPAFYMSEIKDGKEILTPMKQVPPSIGGGTFPCISEITLGYSIPHEVYNGYLYFTIGEVQERYAPTVIGTTNTSIGIWDYIHLNSSDFDYLITNDGNKIKLTAKKATTNENNKIACGTYEIFICNDEDVDIYNDYIIYILRMVHNFTLITYPYTFVID
ncbi:MAG: hypothetical protein LBE11_04525 [Prevotellaceae bacterium]|nr:hypothetical protein [Prevotellaceae bacterium]